MKRFRHPLLVRRVVGHSMRPIFPSGKVIIASSLVQPKVGDVVIAKVNDKDIVKRLAHVSGNRVSLIGDNVSDSSDFQVPSSAIRATVLI